MKAKDLIEKLKTFDPNTIVVTRGFDEDGFADIQAVEIIQIQERKSETAREYIGEYEESDGHSFNAILIDHS